MKILEFLDKGWFKTVLQIIQLSLTIFAVWFSYTIAKRGAESNARNLKIFQSMAAADSSINEVTKGILINLQSIPRASESFKKGLDKMTGSIASLETNLNTFSSSLQNYDKFLKTATEATEKHLELTQKQQEILEAALSKTPKLELLLDRAFLDTMGKVNIQTIIANFGDASVDKFNLIIRCPKSYRFQSNWLTAWDTSATEMIFSRDYKDDFIGPAEITNEGLKSFILRKASLRFTVDKLLPTSLPYRFPYSISHQKESNEGVLIVNLKDIQGYK